MHHICIVRQILEANYQSLDIILIFFHVSSLRQSYDVDIELTVDGTGIRSQNTLDLKNPFFRYTGSQPAPPAGSNTISPTDLYWTGSGVSMVDGDMAAYNGGNSNAAILGSGGAGGAGVLGNSYPAYNAGTVAST